MVMVVCLEFMKKGLFVKEVYMYFYSNHLGAYLFKGGRFLTSNKINSLKQCIKSSTCSILGNLPIFMNENKNR